MKRTRKVRRKKASTLPADPKARSKEEIQKVQNKVTNVILDNSVDMATRVVQSVTESGHITALKFLWQTVGLLPATKPVEEDESPDVLAKILLERMGLDDDPPKKVEDANLELEEDEEEEFGGE